MPVRELMDLLLSAACSGCGLPGTRSACRSCRAALLACGPLRRPLPVGSGQQVTAATTYTGVVRSLLVVRKERAARVLDAPLGTALALAVAESLAGTPAAVGPVLLVPVPSRRTAVRRRGEDTVAALARTTARACAAGGLDVSVVPALRHLRPVGDSAGLDAGARHRNLDGALGLIGTARPLLRSGTVVVVDDLCTTGATLAEAIRALARAGVRAQGAAVVALVPAPTDPSRPSTGSVREPPRGVGMPR